MGQRTTAKDHKYSMDKIIYFKFITLRTLVLTFTACIALAMHATLTPISNKKGKWGFEDENGKTVIKCKYNGVSEFKEGAALVLDGKKYGMINEAGKYILKPEYDMIADFNPLGMAEVIKGDKHGFVNRKGELIIPCKYKYVGAFNSNGLVWVNDGGKLEKGKVIGGKFMIFKQDGSQFLDKPYACVGRFIPWKTQRTQAEIDKLTLTEKRLTNGEDYSFWRKSLIDFIPETPLDTDIRAYFISDRKDGHNNGVITPDGNMIVRPSKYNFANCPEDGISIIFPKSGKANFLDIKSGKMLLSKDIDGSWGFKDGFCIGTEGGLQYIYDTTGQKRSDGYTKIFPANNGTHVTRNGTDKYGLISINGTELLPATNHSVYPCIEGMALVKESSSSMIGYVDKTGQWIIEPQYKNGQIFSGGHAIVADANGQQGIIDKNNNIVMPFEYSNMYLKHTPEQMLIWAKREANGKWECFDLQTGTTIIPASYTDAFPFHRTHDGLALVKKTNDDASWGWINLNGSEVIPCSFSKEHALKAGNEYVESGRSPWTSYKTYIFTLHNNRIPVDLKTTVDEALWDY